MFLFIPDKPKSPDLGKAIRSSSPADSPRGLSATLEALAMIDEQAKEKVNIVNTKSAT